MAKKMKRHKSKSPERPPSVRIKEAAERAAAYAEEEKAEGEVVISPPSCLPSCHHHNHLPPSSRPPAFLPSFLPSFLFHPSFLPSFFTCIALHNMQSVRPSFLRLFLPSSKTSLVLDRYQTTFLPSFIPSFHPCFLPVLMPHLSSFIPSPAVKGSTHMRPLQGRPPCEAMTRACFR